MRTTRNLKWMQRVITNTQSGGAVVLLFSRGLAVTQTSKHQSLAKVSITVGDMEIVTPGPGTYRTLSEFGY